MYLEMGFEPWIDAAAATTPVELEGWRLMGQVLGRNDLLGAAKS